MKTVSINKIRVNGGTQSRASINDETVLEYAEALSDGAIFPPVVLYFDGQDYWLADGFHRHSAYVWARRTSIPADVRQGDRRAAILHSVGANADHGLRRTADDKRRAVLTLLEDGEWSQWSDREVARKCGVSHPFVGKLRDGLTGNVTSDDPRTYTTKHGTTSTMDTANIGKAKAADPINQEPGQPVAPEPAEQRATESEQKAAETPAQEPDPHAAARKDIAKLSREGLEDEVIGLREENAELRSRVAAQRSQIADLKARLKDFDGDQAGAIRRLQAAKDQAGNARWRAEEELSAWKKQVYALKKRVSELSRQSNDADSRAEMRA